MLTVQHLRTHVTSIMRNAAQWWELIKTLYAGQSEIVNSLKVKWAIGSDLNKIVRNERGWKSLAVCFEERRT